MRPDFIRKKVNGQHAEGTTEILVVSIRKVSENFLKFQSSREFSTSGARDTRSKLPLFDRQFVLELTAKPFSTAYRRYRVLHYQKSAVSFTRHGL